MLQRSNVLSGEDEYDDLESAESDDFVTMSRKHGKITQKATFSLVNRNQQEYINSEQNEVADQEKYLRGLEPFLDPYRQSQKSIKESRSMSAASRTKAGAKRCSTTISSVSKVKENGGRRTAVNFNNMKQDNSIME